MFISAVTAGHVLLARPVRREMRAHPALAVFLIGATVAALAAAGWAAFQSDAVRRAVVVLAATGSLVAIVRARPGYGRARGLPPGSLSLGASLKAVDDRSFYAKAAQRWGPVFKMSQIHQPVACVTDLAIGLDFLRSQEASLGQSQWSFNRLVPGGYLEFMTGDAHTRYRHLLSAGFTTAAIEESRDAVRIAAATQLAEMVRQNGANGVDPEPLLLPVAMTSLLRMVLGVTTTHPRFPQLQELFIDLNRPMELFLPVPRRTRETYGKLLVHVQALAAEIAEAPATSRQSVLAQLVERHPDAIADETVVGNLILMVKEGSIMVRGLLRWVLKMLADHPEWGGTLQRVAADPAAANDQAAHFVHETLRLHESRYVYRLATRDVTLGAYRIPRGWLVRLCMGEAHERADHFPEPQRFNPARFRAGLPSREEFCPFGDGRHSCLGSDMAMEIAKVFLREAAEGYEIRTVQDGPAWRINRHWGLWRPSQQFRIAVAARPASAFVQQPTEAR